MALRFSPARGAGALSLSALTRGPQGDAATIAAGSATSLAAGSSPTVTNSGSSSAATFNFGIPRGADTGIKWLYDSTTSMADPGSGDIRFNNATMSSVTAIAVSATGSGSDVSDYVATWDNSTNTTKGHILIREEAGAVAAIFQVDSVTDNTDWLQIAVTYVSGSLSLTAADPLYVTPFLIGNKGADGEVAGPGVSVDSEIALFNGVDGATLKRASGSGLVAASSGVFTGPRTITAPAAGITVSNGDGVAGNPTLALADDLAALEGMSGTGLVARTASNTYAQRTLTAGTGLSVSDGDGVSGNPTVSLATANNPVGKQTIWVPASAMLSATTSGPASAQYESSTNDRNLKVLDFDASADEHAHFNISFPKGWDEGTITFRVKWQSTATDTDGVAWGLEGTAISDNESLDAAWGTAVVVTDDAQSAAGEQYTTSESSAVTIAGSPAEGDVCYFRIFRDVSDANDDMTEDARLIGVEIFYTTNAATDA